MHDTNHRSIIQHADHFSSICHMDHFSLICVIMHHRYVAWIISHRYVLSCIIDMLHGSFLIDMYVLHGSLVDLGNLDPDPTLRICFQIQVRNNRTTHTTHITPPEAKITYIFRSNSSNFSIFWTILPSAELLHHHITHHTSHITHHTSHITHIA